MASTVVNQQNAGLGTMETDQLLDLFSFSSAAAGDVAPMAAGGGPDDDVEGITESTAVDATGQVREKGRRTVLDEIGDLWDEKQYDAEFDLTTFLESMNK